MFFASTCTHPKPPPSPYCILLLSADRSRLTPQRKSSKKWSGEGEDAFAKFKVGFLHPQHLGEVFNMSDPMHILKKIVNALWHRDIPGKKRELGMWRTNTNGDEEFAEFSLKNGERLYVSLEYDGDTMSLEQRVSSIRTFYRIPPSVWKRTSRSFMNVAHSAKVSCTFMFIGDMYEVDPCPVSKQVHFVFVGETTSRAGDSSTLPGQSSRV